MFLIILLVVRWCLAQIFKVKHWWHCQKHRWWLNVIVIGFDILALQFLDFVFQLFLPSDLSLVLGGLVVAVVRATFLECFYICHDFLFSVFITVRCKFCSCADNSSSPISYLVHHASWDWHASPLGFWFLCVITLWMALVHTAHSSWRPRFPCVSFQLVLLF